MLEVHHFIQMIFTKLFKNSTRLVPGDQQDIHESFTLLCSSGAEDMNDLIAEHFQIGCQTTRTCKQCYKHERQSPETLTTIILPVLNGIHDLENSIARNMNYNVFIYCCVCSEDTLARVNTSIYWKH